MVKEICPGCNNVVAGEFNPSSTRKWLTSLAKKGGMKAVLTAAGSVIPGFGNAAGFLAGTAIDIIYGKDINKLVDLVADQFDDNKIYVFTCPNCGRTWSRKEDEINNVYTQSSSYYDYDYDEDEDYEDEDYDEDEDEDEDEEDEDEDYDEDYDEEEDEEEDEEDEEDKMAELFDQSLSYLLNESDQVIETTRTVRDFMYKMNGYARASKSQRIIAAFHFLASFAGLLFLKDRQCNDDTQYNYTIGSLALDYIAQARSKSISNEYGLIEHLLKILSGSNINDLLQSIKIANACKIDEYCWLKKEYYQKSLVPEICFFKTLDIDKEEAVSDEDKVKLWKTLVNCPYKDYRMYANYRIYLILQENDESAPLFIEKAYHTKGFSLDKPDMENIRYETWLQSAMWYAMYLCHWESKHISPNKELGLKMLHTIADLGNERTCLLSRTYLAEIAEEKGDLQTALTYYIKAGEIGAEDAIRVRKLISGDTTKSKSTDTSSSNITETSEDEADYILEVKACLEDGGEISKGERRLLDKLRVKLGISEERAAELEASLNKPQLTEEEMEYLEEYRECLNEGGSISSSERRLLDRLRAKLGISEDRAKELEKL